MSLALSSPKCCHIHGDGNIICHKQMDAIPPLAGKLLSSNLCLSFSLLCSYLKSKKWKKLCQMGFGYGGAF